MKTENRAKKEQSGIFVRSNAPGQLLSRLNLRVENNTPSRKQPSLAPLQRFSSYVLCPPSLKPYDPDAAVFSGLMQQSSTLQEQTIPKRETRSCSKVQQALVMEYHTI